jgi:hypothetical protein
MVPEPHGFGYLGDHKRTSLCSGTPSDHGFHLAALEKLYFASPWSVHYEAHSAELLPASLRPRYLFVQLLDARVLSLLLV